LDFGVSGEKAPEPAQGFGKITHGIPWPGPIVLLPPYHRSSRQMAAGRIADFCRPRIVRCKIVTVETNRNRPIKPDVHLSKNFFISLRGRSGYASQSFAPVRSGARFKNPNRNNRAQSRRESTTNCIERAPLRRDLA
jgi:hypothetical protein